MKPTQKLATTRTPDGSEITLFQHDCDFMIKAGREQLMTTRQHESELELARLGCAHLAACRAPAVLVGGLGLGYTLRQTLEMLPPHAEVVVGELLPDVVRWNREYLAELNGHALEDGRVSVEVGDVVRLIAHAENAFDAILLDIDNGPRAMTDAGNHRLYGRRGMEACRRALKANGCLSVWSAEPSKPFEALLMRCGFCVRRYSVPAYKGSKSLGRFIWVASENEAMLPPGGGAPLPAKSRRPHRRPHRRPQSGRR